MKLSNRSTFLWLSLLYVGIAQAQVPGIKVYTASDGYLANKGYIINQDSAGFIWIGSDQGAFVFDGHQFEWINKKSGLKDKEILHPIPITGRKVILSPLLNNLACYQDGKLLPDSIFPMSQIKHREINKCFTDGRNVWIADNRNRNCIYKISSKGAEKIKLELEDDFSLDGVFRDTLLLSFKNEMYPFYYSTLTHKTQKLSGINTHRKWDRVFLSKDQKRCIAYSYRLKTVQVLELKGYKFILKGTYRINEELKQIIVDNANRLWITYVHKGLDFWGNVDDLDFKSKPLKLMPNSIINHVFNDNQKNIWLTTESSGLYFISESNWASFILNCSMNLPFENATLVSSPIDSSGFLIGNINTETIGFIKTGKYQGVVYKGFKMKDVLKIITLDNSFWAVTTKYLIRLERKNDKIKAAEKINIPSVVKSMHKGNYSKLLYVSSHEGLIRLKEGVLSYYDTLYVARNTCAVEFDNEQVMIGTPSGLYLWTGADSVELVNDNVLKEANISSLKMMNDKNILIGTTIKGMYLFEKETESYRPLKFSVSEIKASIKKIVKVDAQHFWVATDNGVYKVNHDGNFKNLHFKHYHADNGLPTNNVIDLVINHDTAYTLTSSGLTVLLPDTAAYIDPQYKAYIHRVKADESVFYEPEQIVLEHHQKDLEVSVKSFAFQRVKPIVYNYLLEGYHDHWYTSLTSEINVNNIPPGRYTLKVLVDHQTESMGILPIYIKPAFWQQVWFKAFVGLLSLIGIVVVVYKVVQKRESNTLKRVENKRKLAQLELEAIKAHINPHFIYNCLNSIRYFTKSGELKKADKYINSFSVLLRQTMQFSQQSFITVSKEIEYLENYLEMEKMRFKDKLNYQIKTFPELQHRLIPAMMLQPFVENAIKHGIAPLEEGGDLVISFEEIFDKKLKILIRDNGSGWKPKSRENKGSIGLRLAGGRAKTYNELFEMGIEIKIRDNALQENKNTGTIIELLIPTHNENSSYNYR